MFLEYEMGEQASQYAFPTLKTKQTPLLPFAVTAMGDFTCDSRYFTKREGLEECLLFYTIDGDGMIEYNGKQMVLSPGQLLILNCRKYHYYTTKGDKWHFLWIHFAGKCAFDYVDILNAGGDAPLTLGKRISFRTYYEKLVSYVHHFDLQTELEISTVMQNLLTELICLKKADDFTLKYGKNDLGLDNSIAYLQEHFAENISIEQLAKCAHLSKYYYIKVFKAYTGQTPYDCLLGLRLQRAQKMLLETKEAISVIAERTGFSDSKNFIACFKKKIGMTPLQFRKTHAR